MDKKVQNSMSHIKGNVEKCRQIRDSIINQENLFMEHRIHTKQPFINSKKLEDDFIKNSSVRSKAKNFNLPDFKKVGDKLIKNSPLHLKLLSTLKSKSSLFNGKSNHQNKNSKFEFNSTLGSGGSADLNYSKKMNNLSYCKDKEKINTNEDFHSVNTKDCILLTYQSNSAHEENRLLTENDSHQFDSTEKKMERFNLLLRKMNKESKVKNNQRVMNLKINNSKVKTSENESMSKKNNDNLSKFILLTKKSNAFQSKNQSHLSQNHSNQEHNKPAYSVEN